MEQILTQLKQSINEYMDTNLQFNQQIDQLIDNLNSDLIKEPIVPFIHSIDCNFLINCQQNVFLCQQLLLSNGVELNRLFKKCIIRRISKTLLNVRKLWLCLKPNNLPNEFCIKSCDELKNNSNQLISIESLQIVSVSCEYKSAIATKFIINRLDGSEGQKSMKWRVREISGTSADLFSVKLNWFESKSDRVYVSKRKALVIIGNEENCGLKPMEITFTDSIFSAQELDAIYIGSHLESVVFTQISANVYQMLSFDGVSQKITPNINPLNELNFENTFVSRFPKLIIDLYNDRKQSKYSFALSLAFVFADNVCVTGSYFRLKLGLLLSLLSLNEYPKRKNSSVLVICDDTLMISRLLDWSSIFSPNRYLHSSPITPMAGMSRKQSDLEWIDCGSLHMAADGVCVITSACDLNQLPDTERTSLFHALETNEVIAKQSQPFTQNNNQTELKSTVWATIEDNSNERNNTLNRFQSKKILWNEVFGMVYVIDDQMDFQSYEALSERTLTRDVWQNTLDLMNELRPIMTSEAETLLQRYYVAIRGVRGSKCNRLSMETLVSLSKSFAKLSIRMDVTKDDALMAILLYEESLTSRFPEFGSPLNVEPIFHVKNEDIDWAIGRDCDRLMLEFEIRLSQFLKQNDNSFEKTNQTNFSPEE